MSKPDKRRDRDGLYKRREYWHYELTVDGKKRSFTTATKDYNAAKKIRASAVRDLEHGRLPNDSGRRRLEEVSEEYICHRKATVAPGTVRLELERLKPLLKSMGTLKLKDITCRAIRAYQSQRAAHVSNRTVNLETKLLRGMLKSVGHWNRLEAEYTRLKESGGSPGRALTPDQAFHLFSTAESNTDWLVAYQSAVIANDTGMRGVELKHLTLSDIELPTRKLTIRRSKTSSGIRTINLTSDALQAVVSLLRRANQLGSCDPEHFLFPYKVRKGRGYDPTKPTRRWRTAWRALTRKAGVPGFRFHDLRHAFITNHAEIGTPLPVLMAQAGHLSRRMTELYTHISERAMEGARDRFEQTKAEAMAEAKLRAHAASATQQIVRIN